MALTDPLILAAGEVDEMLQVALQICLAAVPSATRMTSISRNINISRMVLLLGEQALKTSLQLGFCLWAETK